VPFQISCWHSLKALFADLRLPAALWSCAQFWDQNKRQRIYDSDQISQCDGNRLIRGSLKEIRDLLPRSFHDILLVGNRQELPPAMGKNDREVSSVPMMADLAPIIKLGGVIRRTHVLKFFD